MGENLVFQVGSTFVCSSLQESLSRDLGRAGIAASMRFTGPAYLSQHMLAPTADSEDIAGTIVLVRVEDWIREAPEAAQSGTARQELKKRLDEFVGQLSVLAMRGRPVWLIVCPSSGWIAETYNLTALCRTYANLLAARVRSLSQVTLLAWPEPLSKNGFFDREYDRTNHIPLTSEAFEHLAESLARQLAPLLSSGDSNAIVSAASAGSPELANFLSGLRLQVDVALAKHSDSADVGRILRMAASFSLSGEKPTLSDAEADVIVTSQDCWLVRVSDRLSDFGASGVLAARAEDGVLAVETFSLSCTVLGKQVEYALLGAVKEIARKRNLPLVSFEYHDSGRNQPVLAFLRSVANENGAHRYVVPVDEIETRVNEAAVAPGAWAVRLAI